VNTLQFIHFHTPFYSGKAGAASPAMKIPHGQQQSQIVLAPQQDGIKQGRKCSDATWSSDDLWGAFNLSWDILVTWPKQRWRSLYSEKWLDIQGFHSCALTRSITPYTLRKKIPIVPFALEIVGTLTVITQES